MFSPATIEHENNSVTGMALAPMAVLPSHQRQGIGKKLVKKGLNLLKQKDCPFVIVLGHPEYYPKFGFEPAFKYNIKCKWDNIPKEAFMIKLFDKNTLKDSPAVAHYRDAFDEMN